MTLCISQNHTHDLRILTSLISTDGTDVLSFSCIIVLIGDGWMDGWMAQENQTQSYVH